MSKSVEQLLPAIQLLWRRVPAHVQIVGPFPLLYGNIDSAEEPTQPVGDKLWGRVVLQDQSSSATNISQTRWRTLGSATLQIFKNRKRSNSLGHCLKAAEFVTQNWLDETRKSDLIYTGIRATQMPPDNSWANVNVVLDYYFDEHRPKR